MSALSGEAWHKEQRRRSQDLIRVQNPTDSDYVLVWDDQKFIIPSQSTDKGWGKGMRVMPRYLAQKFTKDIVDKMLIDKFDKTLEERKAKLQNRGDVDPTYNANIQLQYQGRTDDTKTREPLEDMVWMGVEEEFGVDSDFVEIKPDAPMAIVDPFERLKDKKYKPEGLVTPEMLKEEVKEEPKVETKPKYIPKEKRV
jgi:hypothetical protein